MLKFFVPILFIFQVHSVEVHEQLTHPEQERRAMILGQQLLCPTCGGQTLNDSPIEEAILLRAIIREQIIKGFSDQQIIDWFVGRYGEKILVNPPFSAATYGLWVGPWILLLMFLGGFFFIRKIKN